MLLLELETVVQRLQGFGRERIGLAAEKIHHRAGIHAELWAWILPHGITELLAIILFGGIGFMLGAAVISPGLMTRSESLKQAGIRAGQMCIGGGAMLVLAAMIESYLRQSHLSTAARLGFAAGSAVYWAVYIAFGFMRERAAQRAAFASAALLGEMDDDSIPTYYPNGYRPMIDALRRASQSVAFGELTPAEATDAFFEEADDIFAN